MSGDLSRLRDRLRQIISPARNRSGDPSAGSDDRPAAHSAEEPDVSTPPDGRIAMRSSRGASIAAALGGSWLGDEQPIVIEQRRDACAAHGATSVGDAASAIDRLASAASLLAGGAARAPFLFFDLETTGLSGGAGTHAFLVGLGWFADDGAFVTRQHLVTAPGQERPMLEQVAASLAAAGALVSFNGKSFDAPLLGMRAAFHRLDWPASLPPHVDVLHPARRFWSGGAAPDCSLVSLEQRVLRARRSGDVPGVEIPSRYFQFLRTGDPRPLEPVLHHNRLDLLSLAVLTARLLFLLDRGPNASGDAREALAIGRVYARAGRHDDAVGALEHAHRLLEAPARSRTQAGTAALRIDVLRHLAVAERRLRRYESAASRWRALLQLSDCPAHVCREAAEALAIHYEHRDRDLALAKRFALQMMNAHSARRGVDAVGRRVERLDRKIGGSTLRLEAPGSEPRVRPS